MKKRIFGMLLMGAMVIASMSMFTSCKDYDDDINNLQKQIDGITAQNLQSQLTTLQTALSTAQKAADDAKSAAAAAQTAADKAQKTADAAAKEQTVKDLQTAIDDLKKIISGEADGKIKELLASVASISENLVTAEDVKKLLAEEGFASEAVVKDMQSQIKALEAYKKALEGAGLTSADVAALTKKINDAIATLEALTKEGGSLDAIKKVAEDANKAVAGVNDNINILNVFVKRNLSSLVLRPDTYFGGIEGVYLYSFNVKNEVMKDEYHYFVLDETTPRYKLALSGNANYHVNPANVDLTNYKVDIYSWLADVKEPVVGHSGEATRATGKGLVTEVYNNTDALIAKGNFKDGILKVPFKADVDAIRGNLFDENGNVKAQPKGTIMSLQLTKVGKDEAPDTTVNSDYAIVYPVVAEQLLICDKSFYDADAATHNDIINVDNTKADSYHLHRNFSYLAKANVPATHSVYYKESLNISELLETHYLDLNTNIVDTAATHVGKASWNAYPGDGNASVDATKCHSLSAAQLEDLGLYYDVHLVNYVLGTNKTGESVHMQLSKNEAGEFIATPRNVTADGQTIEDKEATATAVGRMPIVCIELKDKNNGDRTVTFAWMKIRISDKIEQKSIDFSLGHLYADCEGAEGEVTWSQIEYYLLDQKLDGMSKKVFDQTYTYDNYGSTGWEEVVKDGNTWRIQARYGNQFSYADGKFTKLAADKFIGTVTEETNEMWNNTTGTWEDATTHILRWKFTKDDIFALYNKLLAAGKLEDKGNEFVNTEDIVTYVRYGYNATWNTTKEPAIYVKLTIPAGYYHFAKGELGGSKILAYWYNLNSTVNAENAAKAKEVRVNAPVPVPDNSTPEWTYKTNANVCPWGKNLWIHNENLLENTEFIKDLHDFFTDGKLTASIKKIGDAQKFPKLAASALVPEFVFTTPNATLGNATFSAADDGTWTVNGYSGKVYTLKLNDGANKNQILIVKVDGADLAEPALLASISKDENNIQSVIKFHGGGTNVSTAKNRKINDPRYKMQDDILNYKGHKELGERETFTAYIMMNIVDACAPVVFDDMWFNVRFIRPLELVDPKDDLVKDAPNDWQPFDIMKYASVIDWRNYKGDPEDENLGQDKDDMFDFKYYGVTLTTKIEDILTDANLGTDERNNVFTKGSQIDINKDAAYKAKLKNISTIPNFLLEQVNDQNFKYKNNSGINGGFHIFVPVYMEYVFGTQDAKQVQYITVGIVKSIDQPQD